MSHTDPPADPGSAQDPPGPQGAQDSLGLQGPPAPPPGEWGAGPGYPPPPGAAGYPPPPPPGYGPPPSYGCGYVDPQAKSKLAAGLLGIFLGGFGVHRFYLGYTKIGIIQILVTVFTCGIGSLWGFIEGILYLIGTDGYTTDADGRPLKE
jgi:TM2 domain-containing membrane protein YozV